MVEAGGRVGDATRVPHRLAAQVCASQQAEKYSATGALWGSDLGPPWGQEHTPWNRYHRSLFGLLLSCNKYLRVAIAVLFELAFSSLQCVPLTNNTLKESEQRCALLSNPIFPSLARMSHEYPPAIHKTT